MTARSDPSPFFLRGGPVGVLMIHGYPGSPPEMRLVGDYLHERGCTVSAPLLPGHGTTAEDLNTKRWTDWTAHLTGALGELRDQCQEVFVAGLSGGGVLTLYLAATQPELAGAITYSAALYPSNWLLNLVPLGKYLIKQFPLREEHLTDPEAISRIWTYDSYPTYGAHELLKLIREAKRLLPKITCPLLIIHSTLDRDVRLKSAEVIYERSASQDKELVWLYNSGHNILVDSEWGLVAKRTYQFIQAHRSGLSGSSSRASADEERGHGSGG